MMALRSTHEILSSITERTKPDLEQVSYLE
jgi:hypothetical protein